MWRAAQLAKASESTRSFLKKVEYGRRDTCLTYKEKGDKMKRSIVILVAVALATLFCAPNATAFPGERMPYRAAHFASKVAYKIDRHVIHPVAHGIARRL
jgi:hypothetical protein